GIFDIYEAQATTGYIPPTGSDDDNDGIDNAFDDDDGNWGGAGSAGIVAVNTDAGSDSVPDYLDTDSDNDGVPDIQEAWDSLNDGDSQPDGVSGSCTEDSDGDGYVDCFDSNDSDPTIFTTSITPPGDDGSGGVNGNTSTGVNTSSGNELDDVFPANDINGGADNAEPDYRDIDNASCAASVTWYAITEGDTTNDFHWVNGSNVHTLGANTGVVRATRFCEKAGGWLRFYNPLQSDRYILSVQNGTNTEPLENVIDYVEVQTVPAPTRNDDGSEGVVLMRRAWFIATKGSLNGTVNIRFYYPQAEWDALVDSATTMASDLSGPPSYRWFKTDNPVDYTSIPTQFNGYAGVGYVNLTTNVGSENAAGGDTDDGGSAKNYVQFDGLTSFSGGTFGSESSFTLPVEFLDLRARAENDGIHLNWLTATESNSDFFQVERSDNGRFFLSIAELKAAGSSNEPTSYSFVDTASQQQAIVYYRLRSVDLDGEVDYSRVVQVVLTEYDTDLTLQVYPNPSQDYLRLSCLIEQNLPAQIQIIDLQGRVLREKSVIGTGHRSVYFLNIADLARGVYQVYLKRGKEHVHEKFIKE
ncbi:MAG: T9SS type A sorting domain-containing protein, partial [Bacteroidota bacterium]